MVIPTVLLLTLGALGTSGLNIVIPPVHDVSTIVDDYLAFIEPIMRARGDTEIEIDGINDAQISVHGHHLIKHHLKLADHPKLQELLKDPSIPIPFSLSCEKGKLGDISTLKRVGPASEKLWHFSGEDSITLTAQYTLKTMYAKYPKCKIYLANVPYKGQITLRAPHSNFTTTLDLFSRKKECYFTDYSTHFNDKTLELKTTVKGTPYNKLFEQLIDYLIKKNPNDVRNKANDRLSFALAASARKHKGCLFLDNSIRQHVKNKHQ
ncbi:hypothetical protein GE061_007012 [Apolygus lucorum]|uniref:Uncharacterized protein n=1 Tax=Apolygus lucorum TaxID=248454 RepID=A0A8S9WS17_APOLU|nr:hypothetical protein GE061_007012 [Apolygus lucorum]